MKKKFFTIFAFASLLSLSVCNTSCSDDDDDDNKTEQTTNNIDEAAAQLQADNISDQLTSVLAAQQNGSETSYDELLDALKTVQLANNDEQTEAVAKKVNEKTGLDAETVKELINGETPAKVQNLIDALTDEQKANILSNSENYEKGIKDAQTLNDGYKTLTSADASNEEKQEALDAIEKSIKENYQQNDDNLYKEAYINGIVASTGLKEPEVRIILNSEDPKEAIAALLNISSDDENKQDENQDNENNDTELTDAERGKQDAIVVANLAKSLNGKTVTELMASGFITKYSGYRDTYAEGSDEYKQSFKQTLLDEGIDSRLVEAIDTEDIDITTLADALGVKMY